MLKEEKGTPHDILDNTGNDTKMIRMKGQAQKKCIFVMEKTKDGFEGGANLFKCNFFQQYL